MQLTKKDLRNTKRERESAKERLRVLSIEKRILTQSLEEAEAERLEAESRLLRTAQEELKLMRAEHARQMSTSHEAWGTLMDQELKKMKAQNLNAAKKTREETELQMKEVQDSFMSVISKLNETESELDRLKMKANKTIT